MRVRADLVYQDPWAPEPACYLTDEEIGFTEEKKAAVAAKGEAFPLPEFSRPPERAPSSVSPDLPNLACAGPQDSGS